jgi:long-chain acyl-CoA synthetase
MLNEDSGILVSDGEASPKAAVHTIPALLLHSLDRYRKRDGFKTNQNGEWVEISSDEFLLRIEQLFFALQILGIRPRDRVAIISENRLEWAVADYAALCAGATTVPIYPTLSQGQIEALLRDCGPAIAFVSTPDLLQKVGAAALRPGTPCVVFEPGPGAAGNMRLDVLYNLGRQATYDWPADFRRAALSIRPSDLATIIYTSGTTGVPKGAMLTHHNLVSNVIAASERLPLSPDDVSLSFLPLSHIFQRHVDYACVYAGATVAYAHNPVSVSDDLMAVHPTFTAGVPRFFEKIHQRILDEVAAGPSVIRSIFERGIRIGLDRVRTGHTSISCRAAERLIFRRIRARLGGRIRFFISGGAALDRNITEFFWAIGIPVYEGYGLSETSPVITLNGPGCTRFGTVGTTVGDQELRIAEDGEILVRGSNVMKGYYRLSQETRDAFSGGWFHTGDLGEVDLDGYLKITGRKKDLIVTSSGKNIAPQPIENRLRLIPYFDNVVLIGNGRNFISALIVPNYPALAAYSRTHGIDFDEPRDLIHQRAVRELAMTEIARQTADLSPFQKIRKFAFLEDEFSVAGGELTPTLKVRRQAIETKYKAVIDQLYDCSDRV